MTRYDDAEAKQIMAHTSGRVLDHSKAKMDEGLELIKALAALNGTGGFWIRLDESMGVAEVRLDSRHVFVGYDIREGCFVIKDRAKQSPMLVQLPFNPVLNRFEGVTDRGVTDTSKPPRSALAVLVEKICEALAPPPSTLDVG